MTYEAYDDSLDLFAMTNPQWEAWQKAEAEQKEQERADVVRIRGFAIYVCDAATKARDELDKAVASLDRARKKAERALANVNASARLAERWGTFAARAISGDIDPVARRDAAAALEELLG